MKAGDLISRATWYPGRKKWSDKRIGFIRAACASVTLPGERMINVVWLDNVTHRGEWVSEFWLKNVEIISEAR